MINKLIGFFSGRTVFKISAEDKSAALSAIYGLGVPVNTEADRIDGGIYLSVFSRDAKKISVTLDKIKVLVYINSIYGFGVFCARACKRLGLVFGMLAFAVMLFLSTRFVFKLEIRGGEGLSSETVKNDLSALGIRVGAKISELDTRGAESKFLAMYPQYSDVNVNIKGTTVCVEIQERETEDTPSIPKGDLLVASEDAVIREMLVYGGRAAASVGYTVKKGDVLISGFISGSGLQYTDLPLLRYESACGSVIGEVQGSIDAFVPFESEETVLLEPKKHGYIISVFGHELRFGRTPKSENGEIYLTEKRAVTVLGEIELPITVQTVCTQKEEKIKVVRDGDSALALAKRKSSEMLASETEGAELCEIEESIKMTEHGAEVSITFRVLKEIASPKKLEKTTDG